MTMQSSFIQSTHNSRLSKTSIPLQQRQLLLNVYSRSFKKYTLLKLELDQAFYDNKNLTQLCAANVLPTFPKLDMRSVLTWSLLGVRLLHW